MKKLFAAITLGALIFSGLYFADKTIETTQEREPPIIPIIKTTSFTDPM